MAVSSRSGVIKIYIVSATAIAVAPLAVILIKSFCRNWAKLIVQGEMLPSGEHTVFFDGLKNRPAAL